MSPGSVASAAAQSYLVLRIVAEGAKIEFFREVRDRGWSMQKRPESNCLES